MDSIGLSKYRIEKKTILSNGVEQERYYAQYQSFLFGWRSINYSFENFPEMKFGPYCALCFALISAVVGLTVISISPILSIICLTYSGVSPYFAFRYIFRYPETYCTSKKDAENLIKGRIEYLQNKAFERKSAKEHTLPGAEVFYMDLKSERFHKLKRLKYRFFR